MLSSNVQLYSYLTPLYNRVFYWRKGAGNTMKPVIATHLFLSNYI